MVDTVKNAALDFLRSESGATAIEYSFIVALVALSLIFGLKSIGSSLSTMFSYVTNLITTATPTP